MTRLVDRDLEELRDLTLRMGGLAEEILRKSLRALRERNSALSDEVQMDDLVIDRLDVEIDEVVLRLLATKAPVAGDLRFVLAAKAVATDLERVGDLARNIAKSSTSLAARAPVGLPPKLERLAGECARLLKHSLDSFAKGDPEAAREVRAQDDAIDDAEEAVVREAIQEIVADPAVVEQEIELILVAKNLERTADHATNIAEQTVLVAESKNLKHIEKL